MVRPETSRVLLIVRQILAGIDSEQWWLNDGDLSGNGERYGAVASVKVMKSGLTLSLTCNSRPNGTCRWRMGIKVAEAVAAELAVCRIPVAA